MKDDAVRSAGFQFAPQPSVLIDMSDAKIVACNRAFSVLLGYSEEELVERSIDVVVAQTGRATMHDALAATRTSPLLGHEAAVELCREDGMSVRVRMRSLLVNEGLTDPARAVITVDEISTTSDEYDAFFAMLAHELRNRLSNFRLAAQILKRETAPEGSRWQWGLSVMDQQAGELTQLTNDLLDVSRLARGRLTPLRQLVDLRAVVHQTTTERAASDDPDIRPVQWADDHGPVLVYGDPQRLRQVVALLLSLADTGRDGEAAVADDDGPPRLSLTSDTEHVRLGVRGPGIEADLFPGDLDPFRAAARAAAGRPGLGLEPLLIAGLTERMGGEIRVEPPLVELTFPIANEPGFAEDLEETGSGPAIDEASPTTQVLIVDDDAGAAHTLSLLLAGAGITVKTANDGHQGLQTAIDWRPDVALLDLKLPGLDGYALARRLRTHFGESLKIIALTGLDDPADRARVQAAGFDHHVIKPADIDALRVLVKAP